MNTYLKPFDEIVITTFLPTLMKSIVSDAEKTCINYQLEKETSGFQFYKNVRLLILNPQKQ